MKLINQDGYTSSQYFKMINLISCFTEKYEKRYCLPRLSYKKITIYSPGKSPIKVPEIVVKLKTNQGTFFVWFTNSNNEDFIIYDKKNDSFIQITGEKETDEDFIPCDGECSRCGHYYLCY